MMASLILLVFFQKSMDSSNIIPTSRQVTRHKYICFEFCGMKVICRKVFYCFDMFIVYLAQVPLLTWLFCRVTRWRGIWKGDTRSGRKSLDWEKGKWQLEEGKKREKYAKKHEILCQIFLPQCPRHTNISYLDKEYYEIQASQHTRVKSDHIWRDKNGWIEMRWSC